MEGDWRVWEEVEVVASHLSSADSGSTDPKLDDRYLQTENDRFRELVNLLQDCRNL